MEPSTRTVWVRLERKDRIHRWRETPMHMDCSLVSSFSRSTLSKAFEKSSRKASICHFLLRHSAKSHTVVTSWFSQLRFCLNTCWKGLRDECLSRWSIMVLWTMRSSIFEMTELRDMGLYFSTLPLSSVSKTGTIWACFQPDGRQPWTSDDWNNRVKISAISFAQILCRFPSIPSGPFALLPSPSIYAGKRYYYHGHVCVCLSVCSLIFSKSYKLTLMKFGKMMYYDKGQVLFKDGVDRKRYAGHWSKKLLETLASAQLYTGK